jgi:hypothetical protein
MVDFVASGSQGTVILSAIAEKLKRRSKDDFKGRHFDASLIVQAVSWYLRYPPGFTHEIALVADSARQPRALVWK